MTDRQFYRLNLTDYEPDSTATVPTEFTLRSPWPNDRETLAELMLAAYSGTIDDDGGTIEDARAEVDNFFRGEYGTPLLESSRIAVDSDGKGACASLITRWGEQNHPLVAFVMTDPRHQGHRLATILVRSSLDALKNAGEDWIQAVITVGNLPSERLFQGLEFEEAVAC